MTTASAIVGAFLNESLRLIVMPTEQCNYRCSYCYEDFIGKKMKPVVVESVIKLIKKRSPFLKNLGISWFGGEPTLALDVISKIMHSAISCSTENGIVLTSGITTNGHLLTPQNFRSLVNQRVTYYQITLDGSREIHNDRRRNVGGRGDFDRILGNIRNMCVSDENIDLELRIHVDIVNQKKMRELFDDIKDVVGSKKVSISFESLKNLGKELPSSVNPMSNSEFDAFVEGSAVEYARSYGFRLIGAPTPDSPHVCYASLPNNFVIRSDGQIQKCTVTLSNANNYVGVLADDGEIIVNDLYREWLAGWQSNDLSAIGCPAKHIKNRNEGNIIRLVERK